MGKSQGGKPLTIFGSHDQKTIDQIEMVMEDDRAVAGALCADGHLGYSMPIGGVVAYEGAISPTGVGFDIACGNMAVKTNLSLNDFAPWALDAEFGGALSETFYSDLKKIMRQIQKQVAFGLGRSNSEPVDHALFYDPVWIWLEKVKSGLKKKAADQLGTVGSGNHYVDVLVDTSGHIWVANHFGSRGLGHTIASGFFALHAGVNFDERVPEGEEAVVFDTDSEIGAHYIECMTLAGAYAYAGREYVIDQVLGILGAEAVETVHNHHNYAWYENGKWVIRKGATPLTYEPAFIGGSMGDISVIVRGKSTGVKPTGDIERDPWVHVIQDIGNLGSAPHGAGRVMSRNAAAGKLANMWVCQNRQCEWVARAQAGNGRAYIKNGEGVDLGICPACGEKSFKKIRTRDKSTAAINWDDARASLAARGIVVLGAGADESPGVYKDLSTVLAAHPNIEILESLRPLGVVMAGEDERDPYRD